MDDQGQPTQFWVSQNDEYRAFTSFNRQDDVLWSESPNGERRFNWPAIEAMAARPWAEVHRGVDAVLYMSCRALLDVRWRPPEGWKLVPVEPTPEMIKAVEAQWMVGPSCDMPVREYRAAIAAAPCPSTVSDQSAEIERLTQCLVKANEQAERFEREWYLRGDALEATTHERDRLREALEDLLDSCPPLWEVSERARDVLDALAAAPCPPVSDQSAEIERNVDLMLAKIAKLEQERDKLREALERIAALDYSHAAINLAAHHAVRIARNALAAHPKAEPQEGDRDE